MNDRLAGALGTAVILGLIGTALLVGLRGDGIPQLSKTPAMVLLEPTPPPPPVVPPRAIGRSRHGAPPSLGAKAQPGSTPPMPTPAATIIVTPPSDPVVVDSGTSSSQGLGDGEGGRGGGRGRGAGEGDGSGETPPRQTKGKLDFADLPRSLRESGAGGTVEVRYRIDVAGRVDACNVDRSSGNDELDRLTCALIQRRFRFDPARDAAGYAVRSVIVQRHIWTNDSGDRSKPLPDMP